MASPFWELERAKPPLLPRIGIADLNREDNNADLSPEKTSLYSMRSAAETVMPRDDAQGRLEDDTRVHVDRGLQ